MAPTNPSELLRHATCCTTDRDDEISMKWKRNCGYNSTVEKICAPKIARLHELWRHEDIGNVIKELGRDPVRRPTVAATTVDHEDKQKKKTDSCDDNKSKTQSLYGGFAMETSLQRNSLRLRFQTLRGVFSEEQKKAKLATIRGLKYQKIFQRNGSDTPMDMN